MSRRWLRGKCPSQGKIRCRDQQAAEQFARHVILLATAYAERNHYPAARAQTYTYPCKGCGYWHITRSPTFMDNGVLRRNDPVPMEDA